MQRKCLSLRPIPAAVQRVAVYETRTVSRSLILRGCTLVFDQALAEVKGLVPRLIN